MSLFRSYIFFFLNDTATTEIYTLSLHDALPICLVALADDGLHVLVKRVVAEIGAVLDEEFETADRAQPHYGRRRDRKSTRLNSSHSQISYAVFCLKKKKKKIHRYCIKCCATAPI